MFLSCDLYDRYFLVLKSFEALNLKLPDGILGILKPTIYQSEARSSFQLLSAAFSCLKWTVCEVDSKKDIESELKSACETLITNITAHITQPMAAMNGKIGNFLATQVEQSSLKVNCLGN